MADRTPYGPGEWQQQMLERLLQLGYAGFRFHGPVSTWDVIDPDGVIIADFHSTGELDQWISRREAEQSTD